MMYSRNDKQFARPKSVRVFRAARSRKPSAFGVSGMFWHSITAGIMPLIGMGDTPPTFSANIAGNENERARAVPLLSSVSEFSEHDDDELICGAITGIAKSLAAQGRIAYEILPEVGGNSCRLCPFTRQRLFRIPGWYVQWVPREDRHRGNKSAFVFLRSRDVWEISIPPELGGARGHARLLRQLSRRELAGPKFFLRGLEKQQQPGFFDFKEYTRAEQARTWRVTNKWGWTRMDASDHTEFYYLHRSIRREWALAVLRQHIIRELNALLARLGIHAKIVVEGLSSPEEILAISEKMDKGEMGFSEALEAATKRKLPPI